RRLACQVLRAWDDRCEAGNWLQHLLAVAEHTVEQADAYLAHPSRRPRCDWSDPFVIHLMQLLRDHGPDARGGMTWLERHLATRDADAVEVLHREHRRQAANQVSVGNCVTSLRLLAALDWKVFFEHTSLVEAELQEDPAGVYARQDFATRDRYRRMVEQLARGSERSELEVARRALALAGRTP